MATPTQIRRRGRWSLVLGTLIAAIALSAVAAADEIITQDLVTSGNARVARAGSGSAEVYVHRTGGGCDANGDRINVTSNQAWLTIAPPGHVLVTGCDNDPGAHQSLGYSVTTAAPLGGVATVSGAEHVDDPQISTGPNSNFDVTVVPRPPADFASSAKTTSSISLSWTVSPDDADLTNYQLERAASNSGTWSLLTNPATGAANASYTNAGLAPGTEYCYRLAARFQAGGSVGTLLSSFAEPVCVTTNTADTDGDGVADASDNCPSVANPGQENNDGDAQGDACDPDDDNDNVADGADNCQYIANTGQANNDGDAQGDACDPDDDNDGATDLTDNCQLTSNPGQENNDGDAQGDACDPDDDNDTVADGADNCQYVANTGQANNDGDALGDACDPDNDNDTVLDGADNCPLVSNANQADADGDGLGNVCDPNAYAPVVAVAAADATGNEGDTLTTSGSFTDADASPTLTVTKLSGDGAVTHGTGGSWSWSLTTTDNSDGTVDVQVSDGEHTTIDTFTWAAANVAPAATFNTPGSSVDEGGSFGLALTGASDVAADVSAGFEYKFDCGSGYGYGSYGAADTANCVAGNDGNLAVRGTIKDKDGGEREYTGSVTVYNVAPAIHSVTNDGSVSEGSSATVTVNASDPYDALSFEFDCTDNGSYEVGPQAGNSTSCPVGNDGTQTVRVRVSDDDTNTTDTTPITVLNVAPTIVSVGNNGPAAEGTSATVTVTATDPYDALSYEFDCTDNGSYEVGPQAGNSTSCPVGNDGTQTVRVRISDDDTNTTDTTLITVLNVAPAILSVTNTGPVSEGSAATVTVAATDYDALTYSFNCDNNATFEVGPQAGNSYACAFADNGTFTVGVRVYDDDTHTDGATNVVVTNANPSVGALTLGGATGTACLTGNLVTLDFAFTDAGGNDSPWAVDVNWGDGSTHTTFNALVQGAQPQQSHSYVPGAYQITVTVTDKDSGTGAKTSAANGVTHYYNTGLGILQPINSTGPRSLFKQGSTIPVKVKITDCAGTPVATLSPTVSLTFVDGSPDGSAVEDFYSTVADQGNTMRNTGSPDNQYIYNLGTKNRQAGDYRVTISDPTIQSISATFGLKR